ncbi:MAG: proteasome assembly chaperone 4 family protein [Candidatus Bathyarchaeota archaeon]|nr:proteasome assembly chaperone 4 family protein [Candidatus Bathyarchaeota archaeon]
MIALGRIFHEETVEDGRKFSATVIELGNSYIVLLSEGDEENLGTLAVSIPSRPKVDRLPLSSVLLGERSAITARLIAERLAALTNKIVLVSVFLKTISEVKAGQVFLRLLEKFVREGRE